MTMNTKSGLKKIILLALYAVPAVIQALPATPHDARLAWWRDARFGMFIHWGPVSLTGQEISWSRANSNTNCPNNGDTPVALYDQLYHQFNPVLFKADDWVATAQSTGMKYLVFTAKHADGFLEWHSDVDGYNIGATPFQRDVCAELAAAAHRRKFPLGWYFSPMDWRDPDCRSAQNARFTAKNQAELRELLTKYGQVDVLWFDFDGNPSQWDPTNTYALVRHLQPKLCINNRLEMGSFESWAHQGHLNANEDFYTPEQTIGAYNDQIPWETCMTLGTQWAWKPNDKMKTAANVLAILAQCAGGDGNLLLNIGPMPDGRIEPRQLAVLKEVGRWLDKNGGSIYGTRGGPWKPGKTLASTRKGNVIYLHVLKWPDTPIELPDIASKIKSAIGPDGATVKWTQADGKLTLNVPPAQREAGDTVVKLTLVDSAMTLPAVEIPQPETVQATASNVFGHDTNGFGAGRAFDDDEQTRWATDGDTKQAWITARYPQPFTAPRVHISEAYPGRVQKFEFQYRDDHGWQTLFTGTTLGDDFAHSFAPVRAQEFRLNILAATSGPTINEIELLP